MKSPVRTIVLAASMAVLVSFGAAQELRAGVTAQPESLDPQATSATSSFQTTLSLYDGLVEVDQAGEIVPALATGWTISDDGLVWTFTLNEGVQFHNGDVMTSADVGATFARIQDPDFASPKAAAFENITDVATPDDHTVVFTVSAPTPGLLGDLASGWGAILPQSLIAEDHDFSNEPVGTGPFQFREWVRDSYLVMDRFDDYYGEPAQVESVRLIFVTDSSIQLQGLIAGEFHIIDAPAAADIPKIEAHPDLTSILVPSGLVNVAALNTRNAPLDNVLVRRALNYAVDLDVINEVAYGGAGTPIGTFMEAGSPWTPDDIQPYPYDPEMARQLLAEAGYPNGFTVRMHLPQLYNAHVLAGQIIQAQLQEVGVQTQIEIVEWGVWLNEIYGGPRDFDITVVGHTGKMDPTGRLGGYMSDSNYVGFSDPRLTEVLTEAAVSTDWDHRRELYGEALRILHDQAPWIYLNTINNRLTYRSNVEGFWLTPLLDSWNFDSVVIN